MAKQTASRQFLPVVALIIANVLWGINTPLLKIGAATIPVPIFTAIRFSIVALVLLPLALRTWKPLKRRDALLLILSSCFYISLSALLLNFGLQKTSVNDAAVLSLLSPIILLSLSTQVLRERLTSRTLIGIGIALIGALLIIGKPWSGTSLTGNLLVLLSIFCGELSVIISKPLASKTSAWQLTFMNIFPGTIPIVIYALWQLPSWHSAATTHKSWYGLIASTFVILGANFTYYWALQRKRASDTGVYTYAQPVVAIIGGWFLLHEALPVSFALSAVLVAAGVYVTEFSSKVSKQKTAT